MEEDKLNIPIYKIKVKNPNTGNAEERKAIDIEVLQTWLEAKINNTNPLYVDAKDFKELTVEHYTGLVSNTILKNLSKQLDLASNDIANEIPEEKKEEPKPQPEPKKDDDIIDLEDE